MNLNQYVLAPGRRVERRQPDGVRRSVYGTTIHRSDCPSKPRFAHTAYGWRMSALLEDKVNWESRQQLARYFPCTRCRPVMAEVWAWAEGAHAERVADEVERQRAAEFDMRQNAPRWALEARTTYIAKDSYEETIKALVAKHPEDYLDLLATITLRTRVNHWLAEFVR